MTRLISFFRFVRWFCLATVVFCLAPASGASDNNGTVGGENFSGFRLPVIRLIQRPADNVPERRARSQPSVPENYTETPFIETASQPLLTPEEKKRGFLLFHRPITEPVYPNTHPLGYERLEKLAAFATGGEFEPVTFSIYPVRKLENMKVRCSSLKSAKGKTTIDNVTVRLVTYWNIGYPKYTSRETYRCMPELLERITVHTSGAYECQRYWILIQVPRGARPGLYAGRVTLGDDGFEKAVEIPLILRVLDFKLIKDPAKHYSVYYYVRNSVTFAGKSEEFIRKALDNEYRAMFEYGLDTLPTMYLGRKNGKIIMNQEEELDHMLAAGLRGPVPVASGGVIGQLYREFVPDGKVEGHWRISKMPPPEFYEKLTELFRAFKAEWEAKGRPEIICCPIDEVADSHKEFGARVYAAVKAAGIRTYATKDPKALDAEVYRRYLDIWCSQPYSAPYEDIVSQSRYEYWCYPNHNATEIKDPLTMCQGGRMTYGFGLWRSGYTTLIPWHWSWTMKPGPFDYLRGRRSGSGNRIDDQGQVIPAVYWECFREGYDDARYIYTLQQAVFERDGTSNRACRQAVADAKKLLQKTWDDINVQQKYLAQGMWPAQEFNGRRWLLAQAIERLLKYPALRQGDAPSVLVADTSAQPHGQAEALVIESALKTGKVESRDIAGDFSRWHNGTKEGEVEISQKFGRHGGKGMRWRVKVDHETDGGEGGEYPIGWPRVSRTFASGELDASEYDYLSFMVRVDSDRDEVADDYTPLGFLVSLHGTSNRFEATRDLGDIQRKWIPVRFSVRDMMRTVDQGISPWRDISRVQFFIAERQYSHGTNISFDIAEVSLLRFKSPVISQAEIPTSILLLPETRFPVVFDLLGARSVDKGSYTITASMTDRDGRALSSGSQDLATGRVVVLDTSKLKPGAYELKLKITDVDGVVCSEKTSEIQAVGGFLNQQ